MLSELLHPALIDFSIYKSDITNVVVTQPTQLDHCTPFNFLNNRSEQVYCDRDVLKAHLFDSPSAFQLSETIIRNSNASKAFTNHANSDSLPASDREIIHPRSAADNHIILDQQSFDGQKNLKRARAHFERCFKPTSNVTGTLTDKEAIGKEREKTTNLKTTKHKDATYYPNIYCVLCNEWVCSRNRLTHVESHLQYRPYKCSVCGYDNRKEIFISLHISKIHQGNGEVLFKPDLELEIRAWEIAEKSLKRTKEIVRSAQNRFHRGEVWNQNSTMESKPDKVLHQLKLDENPNSSIHPILKCVNDRNVSNTNSTEQLTINPEIIQRSPRNETISPKYVKQTKYRQRSSTKAESNDAPLRSAFNECANSSDQIPQSDIVIACKLCMKRVQKSDSVMRDHIRSHLTKPSYRCHIQTCEITHYSLSWVVEHMQTTHGYSGYPIDIMETDTVLHEEFNTVSYRCFSGNFQTNFASSNQVPPQANGKGESHATIVHNDSPRTKPFSVLSHLLQAPKKLTSLIEEKIENDSKPQTNLDDSLALFPKASSSGLSFQATVELFRKAPPSTPSASDYRFCAFCGESCPNVYDELYKHVKKHLHVVPYECCQCSMNSVNRTDVVQHIQIAHDSKGEILNRMNATLDHQSCLLLLACFPGVSLQPKLHDPICCNQATFTFV